MCMYAIIEVENYNQKVVDARKAKMEAIVSCACFNTKRSQGVYYFIQPFRQFNFENALEEQVNNAYKIQVSFDNMEILNFTYLEYVFGTKNDISTHRLSYGEECAQIVRTYDYTADKDKIKTEMFNDACDYIKRIKKQNDRINNRVRK